nr:MAG TPA: hypothetical protein [Caudoviricetes sp.]
MEEYGERYLLGNIVSLLAQRHAIIWRWIVWRDLYYYRQDCSRFAFLIFPS